jgi:hypothetical protein
MKDDLRNVHFNSKTKERIPKAIDEFFIKYVVLKTKVGGKSIGIDYAYVKNNLFKGKDSLAKEVLKIQKGTHKTLSDLADNLFIKQLVPFINRPSQDNIKMFSKKINSTLENNLVEAFKEIYENHPEFAIKLVEFAFTQSGISQTPISFTKFVPAKLYNTIVDSAIDSVQKGIVKVDLEEFEDLFYRNNSQFIPKVDIGHFEGQRYNKMTYRLYQEKSKMRYLKSVAKSKEGFETTLYKNIGQITDQKSGQVSVKFAKDGRFQTIGDGIFFTEMSSEIPKATTVEERDGIDNCNINGK